MTQDPETSLARDGRHRRDRQTMHAAHNGMIPLIVLVEPQMGENIGAAARAMLNFGLTGLRIVAPRDGWPNPAAKAMAAGASTVIDGARIFDDVPSAIADCTYVLATTARPREIRLPVYAPELAVEEIRNHFQGQSHEAEPATSLARVAILFGGERAGLTTQDVAYANGILSIPVNPDFPSLNLAQAVMVFCYEWGKQMSLSGIHSPLDEEPLASHDEFSHMMDHLVAELSSAGFFHPEEKKAVMVRNLMAMFQRTRLTHLEVQALRGVIKALSRGRGHYLKRQRETEQGS